MTVRGAAVVWLSVVTGCTPPEGAPGETGAAPRLDDGLARRLGDGEVTTVLLHLDEAGLPALPAGDVPRRAARQQVRARARALADRVGPLLAALPDEVALVRRYEHFPVLAVELDSLDAADRVLERPEVASIEEEVVVEAFDTESLTLISQPAAATAGFTGAGVSVAVLDTGADWAHADLGSCTAVGTPSTCRVVYAADTAPNDGVRDSGGHGTNVSAVVAKVAPGADIIALDVFNGPYGYSTDILTALDWVVANEALYDIAAVNMSLGGGSYTAPCVDVFSTAVASVRAVGVSVVVASGNNAYTNAVASPACNAAALTVGAVYDSAMGGMAWSGCSDPSPLADKVTCFSNSASFLDVLAPGAMVSAGGYTMGGTSQASPHVAGAMAVLRAARPSATLDELEDTLLTTGDLVTDHRNGLVFPRIDLAAAVDDCVASVSPLDAQAAGDGESGLVTVDAPAGCAWTVASGASWLTLDVTDGVGPGDVEWTAASNTGAARVGTFDVSGRVVTVSQDPAIAPEGTIVIAAGADGTATTGVTVGLDAPDAAEVCLSNTTTCSAWVPMATSRSWTLTSGGGTKTVYARFRHAYGNAGSQVSDTILLDTTPPSNGTVTSVPGNGAVTLSWSGFADAGVGVSSYRIVQATGTTAPTSCTGATAWTGSDTTATVTGLTNGTTYAFRVCAVDGVGNVSSGATRTGRPVPETTPPVGSVSIAGGADWTRGTSVTLTLAATDASGVTQACVSNTSTCSAWFAMTGTKSWSLSGGNGTRTVYAFYKDAWDNVSAAVTDDIGLDGTAPTNGTVSATPSSGQVALSWSGFADATSGVASYVVVQSATGVAPSSCSGVAAWSGTSTTATMTGLTNGTTYGWRVCARDAAGNQSTGATITGRPAPEYDPPVGTISLDAGAAWANRTTVTATLAATDASTVTQACLSNTLSCTNWFTMTSSRSWTLPGTQGAATVYAFFKDQWGNVSSAVSDDISLDTLAPVNGTLTATPSDAQVTLSWSGFSDAGSGLSRYLVVQSLGTTGPTNCNGATVWVGSSSPAVLPGLTNGTTYTWRVCAEDVAGVRSTGVTATSRPAPEFTPPTGTIVLNNGDAWTRTATVTATLSATDASGVTHACLSSTATCSSWFPYTTSRAFTLTGTSGTKTVNAFFKDTYGNVSVAVADTIGLDTTLPTNGTVTATAGAQQVGLSWSGFADAHSGLASYLVVQATGATAPSNCNGVPVWSGSGTSATVAGLAGGTTYAFRVCAVDVAGNKSAGATRSAVPTP
jgi:subtilisin family serine protease